MAGIDLTRRGIAALTLAMSLCLAVSDALAQEPPRLVTYVHSYAGEEEQFEKFSNLTEFQLGTLGEQLDEKAPEQGLAGLKIVAVSQDAPTSSQELEAAWNSPQTLQIWRGNVEVENEQVFVVTYAYLGGVLGKLQNSSVDLEQELSRRQNRNAKNSHMAVTAYALAMDMKNNGKPANVVLTVLNEAQERAGELDEEVPGHKALQEAIAASIEELRN